MDIGTAKLMASTLALVMTRLAGNYEGLLAAQQPTDTPIVISGGSFKDS